MLRKGHLAFVFGFSVLLVVAGTLSISAHTEEATLHIDIDEDGFHPITLEVPFDSDVTFRNEGEEPHWPASDIHPTHGIYPTFDPLKGIEPGASWTMHFDKVGVFRMHDHLAAQHVGVITVLAPGDGSAIEVPAEEEPKPGFLARIGLAFEKLYYYFFPGNLDAALAAVKMADISNDEKELRAWLALIGYDRAMEKLLADTGNGSVTDCHQEAHRIGREAYKMFGAEIFRRTSLECHSGFLHGGLESLLAKEGTADLANVLKRVCDEFETSFGRFECLHGIGHGVLAYTSYDMPEAIKLCKSLGDSFTTDSCYGGMFMENIVTGQGNGGGSKDHETKWLSKDPLFPCNGIEQNYSLQYQCYQMQTSWMLWLSNYDFAVVAKQCLSAPENMQSVCYRSFGRDAAGHTLRNPAKILELCSLVPGTQGDYRDMCLQGALHVIVDFWGPGLDAQATELCKLTSQERGQKSLCYASLAARFDGIFPSDEQKKNVCDSFESDFQYLCTKK